MHACLAVVWVFSLLVRSPCRAIKITIKNLAKDGSAEFAVALNC